MDQDPSRSSDLPQPLRAVASGLRQLPGAHQVGRIAGDTLDAIGTVSPRGRRMAVYAGAGVLAAAGVVEWPVALTGAAVAWLTQPRPADRPGTVQAGGEQSARAATGTQQPPAGPRSDEDRAPEELPTGPGDRLALTRNRHPETERPVHEQPAKVGDTATAAGLKQVAEATTHHGSGPSPSRAGRHPR